MPSSFLDDQFVLHYSLTLCTVQPCCSYLLILPCRIMMYKIPVVYVRFADFTPLHLHRALTVMDKVIPSSLTRQDKVHVGLKTVGAPAGLH